MTRYQEPIPGWENFLSACGGGGITVSIAISILLTLLYGWVVGLCFYFASVLVVIVVWSHIGTRLGVLPSSPPWKYPSWNTLREAYHRGPLYIQPASDEEANGSGDDLLRDNNHASGNTSADDSPPHYDSLPANGDGYVENNTLVNGNSRANEHPTDDQPADDQPAKL
ncbi:hypothetical protein F5Y18DRAFT_424687 [Xylariaceae sp. FL1019]|nr:hypothetical protein F5Y18DRAFT_424687 [Xylariaceae sp. FL1019]